MPASTWSRRNHRVSLFTKLPGASVQPLTVPHSTDDSGIRTAKPRSGERESERERERGRVGERGKGVVARSFPLRVVEDGCRSTRISLSQKQAPSSRLSLCTHPTPLGVISLHRRVETLRTAFRQPGEGEGVVRTRARGEKIVSLSLSLLSLIHI